MLTMHRRFALALIGIIGVVAFLAAGPSMAYPPGEPLTITAGGGSITVSNGQPGCFATVYVNDKEIGTKEVGRDGVVTFKGDTSAGTKIRAVQAGGDGCARETAGEVVPSPSPTPTPTTSPTSTPSPNPSHTGSNSAMAAIAGLAALGAGGGLVAVSRRRKPSRS